MRTLLAVHRARSLTEAARTLGVDQSTVSRQLRALEQELGRALFARSRAGAHPTPLADELAAIAAEMDAAMRRVGGALSADAERLSGTVTLALPETVARFVLTPRLGEFFEQHPDVRLTLRGGSRLENIDALEADIALRFVRPRRGDLTVRRLLTARGGVFASRVYLAGRAGCRLDELDWVGWDPALGSFPEVRWLAAHVGVEPRLQFASANAIIDAARAGCGCALIGSELAARFPELEEVPIPESARPSFDFWLVRPAAHENNPLVDAVVAWIVSVAETMKAAPP